ATNQITLAAGTYRVKAHAPALQVNNHKVKLYNITDAVDLIIGSSAYASSFAAVSNKSFLEGRFTIEDSKILELQHRCGATKTNNGFGLGSGFVVTEVYSVIEFWKEA
ncbi:hypothetical protein KAR91_04160, partial [Candidatus Pacearchaeota archaeon]|nr:hypothetical protein [Candidatus Pacearchaeota archaeon]